MVDPSPPAAPAQPQSAAQAWPARAWRLFVQAFKFGLVGVAGYVVDVAVLLGLVRLGLDPYSARVPAFLAAASTTWFLNRIFTFRDAPPASQGVARQWASFVVLMLPGLALNYGTYALLVAFSPLSREHLALPVAAGALAGMSANFLVAKRIIFRA